MDPVSTSLLHAAALSARAGIAHGFTSRAGGVSTGPWGPLTLAAREDLPVAELVANWRRALEMLGWGEPEQVALISQVHGGRVIEVHRAGGVLAPLAEADGAWTRHVGIVLAVRVADCVPVLLAGPGSVGVAHAGWRGTAAGVVPATVRAMCEGEGCAPSELVASIGPCISGDAYEVGQEVVDALTEAGIEPAVFVRPGRRGRPHVDLGEAVRAQLRAAGVGGVDRVARCTWSDPQLHSYRRDGASSGRLAGLIARLP